MSGGNPETVDTQCSEQCNNRRPAEKSENLRPFSFFVPGDSVLFGGPDPKHHRLTLDAAFGQDTSASEVRVCSKQNRLQPTLAPGAEILGIYAAPMAECWKLRKYSQTHPAGTRVAEVEFLD